MAESKKKRNKQDLTQDIRSQVFESLKSELIDKDLLSDFMKSYIQAAVENPTGRAGNILARTVFKENMLDLMDSSNEQELLKNREFTEYRLLKKFYDKQRDIILDCNKFKKQFALTSRRTGKTTVDAGLIVYEAITPKSNITYINLTFTNAVKQIFDLVVEYSKSINLGITSSSKNEGSIKWNNGSMLKIAGNSSNAEADKLRGFNCRLAIIDEIGHQRNIDYLVDEVLLPQMVDYEDSTILLTGTPSRVPHHFSTRIFEEENNGWKKYNFNMLDNPFIPNARKFIEEEAKAKGYTMEDPFILREYFGKIVPDTEALVFKSYKTSNNEINFSNFNPIGINIGGDYGYQDYNGVVTIVYNKEKAVVIKEDKFNKAPVSLIINKVREHYDNAVNMVNKYEWKNVPIRIYADYNEESITKELSVTYSLPAFNCYKYDKAYAIEKLAEFSRTGKLIVPLGGICAYEMDRTLYKRDKSTDTIISEISDEYHPDVLMALLYASRRMFFDMGVDVKYKMQEGEDKVETHSEQIKKVIYTPIEEKKQQFKDIGVVG